MNIEVDYAPYYPSEFTMLRYYLLLYTLTEGHR
jgi:hypothetical protein